MKLKPLGDRVVVKHIEEEKTTPSGIVIPDSATEKPNRGEVVAVGVGKRDAQGVLVPVNLAVGAVVLFKKYSGTEFKIEGVEYLTMREDDVIAQIVD